MSSRSHARRVRSSHFGCRHRSQKRTDEKIKLYRLKHRQIDEVIETLRVQHETIHRSRKTALLLRQKRPNNSDALVIASTTSRCPPSPSITNTSADLPSPTISQSPKYVPTDRKSSPCVFPTADPSGRSAVSRRRQRASRTSHRHHQPRR